LAPSRSEKHQSVSEDEFYRRVDAGERPYTVGREMGVKSHVFRKWMQRRPSPTKVQVTVTPPRPSAAEPMTSQTQGIGGELPPGTPVTYLTEDECIDLYKFIYGREGLICDGLLSMPEAGRSDERCKVQGERLYAIAVKYGWDREQVLGFLGIAMFAAGTAQDSWIIYKAWSKKQDEKKPKKEQKPSVTQGAVEVQENPLTNIAEQKLKISTPAVII